MHVFRTLIPAILATVLIAACIGQANAPSAQGPMQVEMASDAPTPNAPTLSKSVSGFSVTLSWTALPHWTGSYEVARKRDAGSWESIDRVSATSYTDSVLTAATTTFRVRANFTDSSGVWSNEVSVTLTATPTPTPPPPVVTSLTVQSITSTSVTLTWTASGATSYDLYRRVSGGAHSEIASDLTATTYTDSDSSLTAGTTYVYFVIPKNSIGDGLRSDDVSATLPTPTSTPTPTPTPTPTQ